MISRAGLRPDTAKVYPAAVCELDVLALTAGNSVAVVGAERAGRVFGERVAVALAVRRPHERCDHVERPVGDRSGFPPEIGEPEVDIELEQIDTSGLV